MSGTDLQQPEIIKMPDNIVSSNPTGTPNKSKERRSSSTSDADRSLLEPLAGASGGKDNKPNPNKKPKSGQLRLRGQKTLDSFTKQSTCSKSEFEILCSKMEEMRLTLQNVVKVSDLDEKLKCLVTKEELKDCISKETEKIQVDNDKMRSQLFDVQRENDALKLKVQNLECAVLNNVHKIDTALYKGDLATEQVNELEQHGRSNTVRIYGISDIDKFEGVHTSIDKSVELINDKLEMDITARDICIAHRLGPFVPNQTRGMIVKFVRRADKITVMQRKKKLDETQWSIKEDTTIAIRTQMEKIRTKENIPVWCQNGKIYSHKHGRVVPCKSDLRIKLQNFERRREKEQQNRDKEQPNRTN